MPQVWGLLSNQINKLLHHWDCQNQKLSNTKVKNLEKKKKTTKKEQVERDTDTEACHVWPSYY